MSIYHPIKKLRIKNFRSIKDFTESTEKTTVFVGCNDEGKSNMLRALDLFFNHGAVDGYDFDWDKDYCAIAKQPKNKAKEIEIKLTLNIPSSFSIKSDIEWKKVWRQSGLHTETITASDGSNIPLKSKATAFIKSIRFDYVPAIKGPDYFSRLLARLHDMLDATVREDIRNAANGLTNEIRKHTANILSDLYNTIGLTSKIELPSDLRALFSDLDFKSDAGGHSVSFSQRGDGIKTQHIPIILNWMAEQANHLTAPGRPRVVTIWGYEEPENNLEIRRCFDLADYFTNKTSASQVFLTTHSPVFYSTFTGKSDLCIYEVRKDTINGSEVILKNSNLDDDINDLHSSIGFLELLEPHIKSWKEKTELLQKKISDGFDVSKPSVFLEGPSDLEIFSAIEKRFFSSKFNFQISRESGGGHNWVKDMLIAWEFSRPQFKAVGIFDTDPDALVSHNEANIYLDKRKSNRKAYGLKLKALGPALEIRRLFKLFPYAIEDLMPVDDWKFALSNGWLEERENLILILNFKETKISLEDWVKSKITNEDLRLVLTNKISDDHKKSFSKHISKNITSTPSKYDYLKDLFEDINSRILA